MAIVAGQTASSTNSGISIWSTSQTRENCLPLHVAHVIGTLLSLISSQNQISFLHIPHQRKHK
uniref:Uncharacterized protein n=1 Tax=Rhizophora mucronata TaxID=61149 RepID=A0A2P2JA58_RHIMU